MKNGAGKTVKKQDLPSKDCIICGRPFTWRKKWERNWDEVTTCSKSCNAQRKRGSKGGDTDNNAAERKNARKKKREGTADPSLFSKVRNCKGIVLHYLLLTRLASLAQKIALHHLRLS